MQHMYPLSKGDQLCPLGFHPQVRWPTRCKRCFRDYKEHGFKRGNEDVTISSPNITETYTPRPTKSWTSTQNLSADNSSDIGKYFRFNLSFVQKYFSLYILLFWILYFPIIIIK